MSGDYRMVVWGDSLAYGNQDASGNTLETILAANLNRPCLNKGVGGQDSTQVKTRFDAAPTLWDYTSIFWVGRNNNNFTTLNSDVAGMVAELGHTNFIILSIVNFNLTSGTPETTGTGSASYNAITTQNNTFRTNYPNNYVDARGLLVANYNPALPTDVDNFNVDAPPPSLMYDDRHPNQYGDTIVANACATLIRKWNIKYGSWRLGA